MDQGLAATTGGSVDYFDVPYDATKQSFKGHVFINFSTPNAASDFYQRWNGLLLRGSEAPLAVSAARVQGREANLRLLEGKPIKRLAKHGHLPYLYEGQRRLRTREVLLDMGIE